MNTTTYTSPSAESCPDEENESQIYYHEIGSAGAGNRQVLCPRCFARVNHARIGESSSNPRAHWQSNPRKEPSGMFIIPP